MIAYKGFGPKLESTMGRKDDTALFRPGETKEVESSKTAREGFHCCEYIFDCMKYYPMNGENRFWRVEAAGDIDEDDHRIACTKITLINELNLQEITYAAMLYIIQHPHRDGWEVSRQNIKVAKDEVVLVQPGTAIARGEEPKVKAPEGSVIGLIREEEDRIVACKLMNISAEYADRWLHLGAERRVRVE